MAPLTVLLEAITISMHIILDTREGAENIIFHPNNIALYFINSCARFYESTRQGGSDGSGRHSAAPMLTAIMSGGVGISGRGLSLSC